MGFEAVKFGEQGGPSGSQAAALPPDIAPPEPLVEMAGCEWNLVHQLEKELGLSSLAAQTLSRRGVSSIEEARQAILPGDLRDPKTLPGVPQAAQAILGHIERGTRIAVHGDYDVDGVCSTAILVRALAQIGSDVTWHVPSRFGDGYGLTNASVERLRDDGAGLIIAVDCGIGSAEQVEFAAALGTDVVICDHHSIPEELPDCPVVHPGLGSYPDPYLCAAAATHKLASEVVTGAGGSLDQLNEDLAMVALATVCDVVPLRGENRAIVSQGIAKLRSTQSPGLRELMRVAGVDQLKLDSGSLGFALGPRINAVGRMHSADPAVELMLTSNSSRAAELAEQLGAANHRRREIEQQTLQAAETQAREQRDQFGIVVAGEGWHPGVLGIVAGRIAESYRRPALALSIDGPTAAGSGRSGGRYDLHGGLTACSDLLIRFGGHRAAAGLELDVNKLEQFRAKFVAYAAEQLGVDDLRPRLLVDAVGSPADINLKAIEELERLGPFGAENPRPRILIPATLITNVSRLGRTGQHFKLAIADDSARASVVAFRQERLIDGQDVPRFADMVVELQRNEFNGREEAQAVMQGIIERTTDSDRLWIEECERGLTDDLVTGGAAFDPSKSVDRRGAGVGAALLEHAADAGNIAIAANDVVAMRAALDGVVGQLVEDVPLAVLSYDDPRLESGSFDCVVMAEPPPAPELGPFSGSKTVICWSERNVREAAGALLARDHLVAAFRAVRESSGDLSAVYAALKADLPSARVAGRALRALEEIDVVAIERKGTSVDAVVARDSASSNGAKRDLDESFTFRSYSGYRKASEQWLRSLSAQPTQR